MYCRTAPFALFAILLASCAREPAASGPERTAILRFENLSGDASLAWQGRAFSEVLSYQLGAISSARLHGFDRILGVRLTSAPGISTERTQAMAAGATRIGYGEYTVRNGKLEARLTIEDPRTLKMVRVVEVTVPSGDVLGAATAIARQVSDKTVPFATASPEALMLFVRAMESPDPAGMDQALTQSMAADPDFYPAYHSLAQIRLQRQDRAGAQAIVQQVLARKNVPEKERARFELESAELAGDADARLAALLKLTRIEPTEPGLWRALADTSMARHDYRQAMQALQKASELSPGEADLLNSLGYAAVQSGDLDAAMAALRRYQTLRPNEANPLDSMGDVNLAGGRLSEAESFFLQAQKKDRAFLNDADLLKAAIARLYSGDLAAADKLADQFLEARKTAQDPVIDYRRAQWSWIAGRRKEALRQMEAFALAAGNVPRLRDMAARAWTEMSLWNLMLGDRNGAAQLAQKALSTAGATAAGNAFVVRFLALPEAPAAEWISRAAQQFPAPAQAGIKNFVLAHALLLSREFAAAQPLLKQMWENGSPVADEGLPVLLAWTLLETGNVKDATALLRNNPILTANVLTPYTAFYLPRLFYLRGLAADKEGRRDEARTQYRRFLDLSGPDPLVWGEEKKARAGL